MLLHLQNFKTLLTKFNQIYLTYEKTIFIFDPQFNGCKIIYFDNAVDDKIFLRYNAISNEMEMSLSPYAIESDHVLIKDSKVYCSILRYSVQVSSHGRWKFFIAKGRLCS